MRRDWRTAPLGEADRALCAFAEGLARASEGSAAAVEALRAAGFDDGAIHDAAQLTAYFCYINRVAGGLGVDLEPDMPAPGHGTATGAESLVVAAGEAMAPDFSDSGTMTIVWKCLRCNHHFPAGEALPDACAACGAPRTEFALVEED